MTTTPPPPSTLRIPPSPRFGAGYDQYSPYATRHSARLASQRASQDSTPPPRFPSLQVDDGTKSAKKEKNNHDAFDALSPPGSIHGSPRKKPSGGSRTFGLTHSLEDEDNNTSTLADPFALREPSPQQHPHSQLPTTRTNGMLPTPAKTPKKKAVADMGPTARTLFPPSSRPKKSRKHTGFSLDSFNDDPAQNQTQIQIYTDSRDRIPEVDQSEENLFYKPKETKTAPTPANPPPVPSKRSKAVESKQVKELKRDKEVDDAVKREDGMFYVFRGKRMFRKFADPVESDGEDDDDDLGLLASRPDLIDSSLTSRIRPLTRSSIKPRVLFPSAKDNGPQQGPANQVDEEAATDIEDHTKDTDDAADQATDVETQQRSTTPPPKADEAIPSPGRSLRPRAKREDATHHEATPATSEPKRKRVSPFDGWLRKKPTPAAPGHKSKKRDHEAVGSPGGPSTKKTRATRATASSAWVDQPGQTSR